jgi:hypothetical protein
MICLVQFCGIKDLFHGWRTKERLQENEEGSDDSDFPLEMLRGVPSILCPASLTTVPLSPSPTTVSTTSGPFVRDVKLTLYL